ncbi:hypothetical protein KIPB_008144 [Kipferlia bialata]|uniref:Uncharacterized protein n=1 Tax=Kipferlia bialata TaxID=797122 RepID=A0A9K3D2Z8_9EUKA|nr:hypothetical protein KIPB_008144 [Kipferlia bialata]|eukprot:g8144.t1
MPLCRTVDVDRTESSVKEAMLNGVVHFASLFDKNVVKNIVAGPYLRMIASVCYLCAVLSQRACYPSGYTTSDVYIPLSLRQSLFLFVVQTSTSSAESFSDAPERKDDRASSTTPFNWSLFRQFATDCLNSRLALTAVQDQRVISAVVASVLRSGFGTGATESGVAGSLSVPIRLAKITSGDVPALYDSLRLSLDRASLPGHDAVDLLGLSPQAPYARHATTAPLVKRVLEGERVLSLAKPPADLMSLLQSIERLIPSAVVVSGGALSPLLNEPCLRPLYNFIVSECACLNADIDRLSSGVMRVAGALSGRGPLSDEVKADIACLRAGDVLSMGTWRQGQEVDRREGVDAEACLSRLQVEASTLHRTLTLGLGTSIQLGRYRNPGGLLEALAEVAGLVHPGVEDMSLSARERDLEMGFGPLRLYSAALTHTVTDVLKLPHSKQELKCREVGDEALNDFLQDIHASQSAVVVMDAWVCGGTISTSHGVLSPPSGSGVAKEAKDHKGDTPHRDTLPPFLLGCTPAPPILLYYSTRGPPPAHHKVKIVSHSVPATPLVEAAGDRTLCIPMYKRQTKRCSTKPSTTSGFSSTPCAHVTLPSRTGVSHTLQGASLLI